MKQNMIQTSIGISYVLFVVPTCKVVGTNKMHFSLKKIEVDRKLAKVSTTEHKSK